LRLGIGRDPDRGTVDYVLSRFDGDETALAARVVEQAAEAVECWVVEGIEQVMNRYNGPRIELADQGEK
jgi:PTH1 family peptidyl-tRNA hydrolase